MIETKDTVDLSPTIPTEKPAQFPSELKPKRRKWWLLAGVGLLILVIGSRAVFLNVRKSAPVPSPSPIVIPSPTPSPSPSPSPTPSPKASPTVKSSPSPTPSPVAKFQYILTSDYKDVPVTGWNALGTAGKDGPFGVSVRLTDQAGNLVNDQTSFRNVWVNENESILTMRLTGTCEGGVWSPCPINRAEFVGKGTNTGQTTVTVTAYKGEEQISNTYVFNITVSAAKNPTDPPAGW